MRLLNTRTLLIEDFQDDKIPSYAILSHTWRDNEVLFKDMTNAVKNIPNFKEHKVVKACDVAAARSFGALLGQSYEWIWIDTCCIDKSNSAELTEAINSMYDWYRNAGVCYVYLDDLPVHQVDCSVHLEPDLPAHQRCSGQDLSIAFQNCRWFTRGWTLQELMAPKHIFFFDKKWNFRGTKMDLIDELSQRTRISRPILLHDEPLSTVSVAQKMSWAAERHTTRVEDTAYCLLGIFGVHLSMRYGERHRAFRRLQEAIISSGSDLSVFAWKRLPSCQLPHPQSYSQPPGRDYCGVLAKEPRDFEHSGNYIKKVPSGKRSLLSLNGSLLANLQFGVEPILEEGGYRYLLPLDCQDELNQNHTSLYVRLRKCGYNEFVREDPSLILTYTRHLLDPIIPVDRYLLPDISSQPWAIARSKTPLNGLPIVDPIGQSRTHAIQLQLPPEMWLQMLDIWPAHRFDGEDRVFFLPDTNTNHDSCMARLSGGLRSEFGDRIEVNIECVFIALGWSSTSRESPPQCTLLDYSAFTSVSSEFRSEVCGWDFQRNYTLERLVYHSIPKTSSVVIRGRRSTVRVSFKVSEGPVTDKNVCGGTFWRVHFSYERINDDDDQELEASEGWIVPKV